MSINAGIKNNEVNNDTPILIAITKAKSTKLLCCCFFKKNIMVNAPIVVNVAAKIAKNALLFPLFLIWSIMIILLSIIIPKEIVIPAKEYNCNSTLNR